MAFEVEASWCGHPPLAQRPDIDAITLLPVGPTRARIFGQDHAYRQLYAITHRALAEHIDKPMASSVLIALYGRGGQGKSAVISKLREALKGRMVSSTSSVGSVNIAEFDITEYSSIDLRDGFDEIFSHYFDGSWRWLAIAGLLLLAGGIFCVWWIFSQTLLKLGVSGDVAKIFAPALVGVLVIFVRAWRYVGPSQQLKRGVFRRRLDRAWSYGRAKRVLDYIIERLSPAPNLLFVENLDQAAPDQQEAFLNHLRNRREDIRAIVIVAFDEKPLLRDSREVWSAQRLIQNTFDVAVRLRALRSSDAVNLATLVRIEFSKQNPGHPLTKVLGSALVASDLCRIFFLLDNSSASAIVRLFNDIVSEASVLGIRDPRDFSALARIHGMFTILPRPDGDQDALIDTFRSRQGEKLISAVEERLGRTLPDGEKSTAIRFFEATVHMQASHGNWSRIFGRLEPHEVGGLDANESFQFGFTSQGFLKRWCYWDLSILRAGDAQEQSAIIQKCISEEGIPSSFLSDVEELRAERMSDPMDKLIWRYLVRRLQISRAASERPQDGDVSPLDIVSLRSTLLSPFSEVLSIEDREEGSAGKAFMELIVLAPPGTFSMTEAAYLLCHSGSGAMPRKAVREWLVACMNVNLYDFNIGEQWTKSFNTRYPSLSSPVESAWPFFGMATAGEPNIYSAELHFRALGTLLQQGCNLVPDAHAAWLSYRMLNRATSRDFGSYDAETILILKQLIGQADGSSRLENHWPTGVVPRLIVKSEIYLPAGSADLLSFEDVASYLKHLAKTLSRGAIADRMFGLWLAHEIGCSSTAKELMLSGPGGLNLESNWLCRIATSDSAVFSISNKAVCKTFFSEWVANAVTSVDSYDRHLATIINSHF